MLVKMHLILEHISYIILSEYKDEVNLLKYNLQILRFMS